MPGRVSWHPFFFLNKDTVFIKPSVGSFFSGFRGVIFGSVTCRWTVDLWFLGLVSVAWGVPSTPHRLPALGVWAGLFHVYTSLGFVLGKVAGDWVGLGWGWNRSCLFCGNTGGWSEGQRDSSVVYLCAEHKWMVSPTWALMTQTVEVAGRLQYAGEGLYPDALKIRHSPWQGSSRHLLLLLCYALRKWQARCWWATISLPSLRLRLLSLNIWAAVGGTWQGLFESMIIARERERESQIQGSHSASGRDQRSVA